MKVILYLLGWVDKEAQKVTGLKIRGGLSLLLFYDFTTPVTGLNAFPVDERPSQVNAVFQFYHIMVVIGMLLIALTFFGSFMLWRNKLFDKPWLLGIFVVAVLLPQISNQLGWFAAEMGRQPWVVYGLLRTSDALSPSVSGDQVLFSLILFTLIYLILFLLFLYLLDKKIKLGPYDEGLDRDRPLQSDMVDVVSRK